jgi:regulator of sigma E protease
MLILSILLGLFILTVIVVIHELGHALVAKRNGVIVEEFGIGFPPRAFSKKVKKSILGDNVTLSVNWLPIGGFVKLQGEHDNDSGKGDYGSATFWQKTKILLAGVAMNWLTAAVLLTILALVGIPRIIPDQFTVQGDTHSTQKAVTIASVQPDSPAAQLGLQTGDEIVSINGETFTDAGSVVETIKENQGEQIEVTYERNGETKTATATLRSDAEKKENEGNLGAGLGQQESLRATWSAPIVGIGLTAQMTVMTLQGLGDTLSSFVVGIFQKINPSEASQAQADENLTKAGDNVAGPVGLLGSILPRLVEAGPAYVILIAAVISISLAVINALPIPALDGGRWTLTAIYRVLKRPLTPEREEAINGIGFLLLMGLFVLITVADVGKIVG